MHDGMHNAWRTSNTDMTTNINTDDDTIGSLDLEDSVYDTNNNNNTNIAANAASQDLNTNSSNSSISIRGP
jgi:hypothetical protein